MTVSSLWDWLVQLSFLACLFTRDLISSRRRTSSEVPKCALGFGFFSSISYGSMIVVVVVVEGERGGNLCISERRIVRI